MTKEGIVYLNGVSFPPNVKPKQVLGGIFCSMPNRDCWSYEALKELYVEGIKMVSEVAGKVTNGLKLIKYVPKGREEMLARIYESILSSEGLSNSSVGSNRALNYNNIYGRR
uniref:Uncharacterized protein n=1 Tax=viral metagenome TaxID=1070528 RepID=A0A6M3JVU8_9ZZZZ